jgi:hypothetical protein
MISTTKKNKAASNYQEYWGRRALKRIGKV